MERPTWATVVGILVIIFGCLGLLGSILSLMTPMVLDIQENIMQVSKEAAREAMESEEGKNTEVDPDQMLKMMDQFMSLPPWYGSWKMLSGLLAFPLYGLYLFSGILLLQVRPIGIKLLYISFAAVLAFAVVNLVVIFSSGSFIVMAGSMSKGLTIILNGVLLVVLLLGDKRAFLRGAGTPQEHESPSGLP